MRRQIPGQPGHHHLLLGGDGGGLAVRLPVRLRWAATCPSPDALPAHWGRGRGRLRSVVLGLCPPALCAGGADAGEGCREVMGRNYFIYFFFHEY